jgi:hypothetical protein
VIWLEDLSALKIDVEVLSKSPVVFATSLYTAYPMPKRVIGSLLGEHDEFEFIQWPYY